MQKHNSIKEGEIVKVARGKSVRHQNVKVNQREKRAILGGLGNQNNTIEMLRLALEYFLYKK